MSNYTQWVDIDNNILYIDFKSWVESMPYNIKPTNLKEAFLGLVLRERYGTRLVDQLSFEKQTDYPVIQYVWKQENMTYIYKNAHGPDNLIRAMTDDEKSFIQKDKLRQELDTLERRVEELKRQIGE